MRIRKKTFILLITYLSAAVIALGAYTAVQSPVFSNYRRSTEYGYAHAFSEVVTSVSRLDAALCKASYAKGREIGMSLCGEIYESCLAAEMCMAVLPFSSFELEKTSSFIAVCGDYAASLLASRAQDGFSDAERQSFAELSKLSASLNAELQRLETAVNEGGVIMDAPEKLIAKDDERLLGMQMKAYEETMAAMPKLEYSGKYTLTEDAVSISEPVSENEAKAEAERFSGKKITNTEFTAEDGTRCFSFDGGSVRVDAEGNVLSLSSERSVAGSIDDETLLSAAKDFLRCEGFDDMRCLRTYRSGSVLTAEFSPIGSDGVLVSDAVIRVSVAADDASLYAFDAEEYYKNAAEECGMTPAVSMEEAALALPSELEPKDCTLELCTLGGKRVLCYDFALIGRDGEALHILVDAQSGSQLEIVL